MNPTWTRRQMIGRLLTASGAVVLAGPATTLLAGCGSDDESASGGGGGGDGTAVGAQLSWLTTAGFAGEYIADEEGYWSDEGLDVTLAAGGPNVQSVPTITSGRSLVTWSVPDAVIPARTEGAEIVFLGAVMRRPPYAIISPADSPISEPGQMKGKRIGVQPNNELLWATFLELNVLDEGDITKVVAGFDPQPLAAGDADGWLSYATDEPVTLAVQGFPTETLLMADFGYQGIGQGIVVTRAALDDEADRESIRAFVAGSRKGWESVVADPAPGAELTVSRYGTELGIDREQADGYLDAMVPLITADGDELFRLSDELKAGIIESMDVGGLDATVEDLFDDSILDEIEG